MRLFVGVWPDPQVRRLLAEVPRPDVPSVRWTTAEQWHVTVAFLGEVPPERVAELSGAVVQAAAAVGVPPLVAAGPATARLGRSVLYVPVSGLEGVAAEVQSTLRGIGAAIGGVEEKGFRGHLTLARARGGARIPPSLVGVPFSAEWSVGELCLAASTLAANGARYETVATGRITTDPTTID